MRYQMTTPVNLGSGVSKEAGNSIKAMGATKVLLITDDFISTLPYYAEIKQSIIDAGLEVVEFTKCLPDPPEATVDQAADFAKENGINGVVALGGGSVLDTAKAVCLLVTNNCHTADLYGKRPANKIPLVAVPTNSGTGSEVTTAAVITNAQGRKGGLSTPPHLALVDPELTKTAPAGATAASALDAFAHSVEAITSGNIIPVMGANPFSETLAASAIERIMKWLPVAVENGQDTQARTELSVASNFAGIAFNCTGCHLGHSIAHSVGSAYHINHGLACGLAMPVLLKFTAKRETAKTAVVAKAMGVALSGSESAEEMGNILSAKMTDFLKSVGVKSYKEMGYTKEQMVGLADMVMTDTTWMFVAKPVEKAEIEAMLADMYDIYQ